MISKEEFIKNCDSKIPKEEIEEYNKCTKKMWITLLVVVGIEILLSIFLCSIWGFAIFIALPIIIISIVVIVATLKYKWKEFKKRYSQMAFECLLEGYKFDFKHNDYISQTKFASSGFGGKYDNYTGEDLLTINIPNDDGTPSGVQLNICDLHVTREETRTVTVRHKDGSTSTETRTYTVTVYDGVFGYIYFPFKFKCNAALNIHFSGQKRIKLEDIKFNKMFKTYTDNQLEALVILTPTLMNKLISFAERIYNFKLSLQKSGAIYFGMQRNLFELNKSVKPSGRAFEWFYQDIQDILAMVNEIKSNNKVFKM